MPIVPVFILAACHIAGGLLPRKTLCVDAACSFPVCCVSRVFVFRWFRKCSLSDRSVCALDSEHGLDCKTGLRGKVQISLI